MPSGKSTIGIVLLGLLAVIALLYVIPESYQYLTQDQSRQVGGPGDEPGAVNPPLENPVSTGSYSYAHAIHGIPDGAFVSPITAGMWEDGGFFVVDLLSTEGFVSAFAADGSLTRRFAILGANGLQELVTAKLGPDGLLYLLDTSAAVHVYRRDGSFVRRIELPPNVREQVFWVRSLTVDTQGTLYLLALDTIVVLDSNGRMIARYTGEGQDWLGVRPSEFYLGPSDLCLGPNGILYVADAINYRILALDAEGRVVKSIAVPETNGSLPRLGNLVSGEQGQVHIMDHQSSAVREYSEVDGWSIAAKLPQGTDNGWEEYYHISAGAGGSLLIADGLNPGLWQLLPGRSSATRWAGTGTSPLFIAPVGIAVSQDGGLQAVITDSADPSSQQAQLVVLRRAAAGYELAWSRSMENPRQVGFTAEGGIVVLDEVSIKHYSETGELLNAFGEEGMGDAQFAVSESIGGRRGPQGFALVDGRVWVADTFNHRLLVFDLEANLVQTISLPEELYPTAIALTANHALWVLDAYAGRLHQISEQGKSVAVIGEPGTGVGQFGVISDMDWFDGPHALLAAGDRLFVVDTYNHRVQIFDENGGFLETLGEGGAGAAQFFFPSSVAADDEGRIYIADSKNHRVQVYFPR